MKIKDIMSTDVVCAKLPGNRTDLLKLMASNNITGLPVVKTDNTLAGFITRQDIYAKPDEEQLALVMKAGHPILTSKDSIEKAAKTLLDHDIHHLPIVKGKKVVGILTPADYLAVIEKMDLDDPIEDYVRTACVPVHQDSPITALDVLFRVAKVVAAPVLDDEGKLVGIVTDRDLFNLSIVSDHTAVSVLGIGEDEDSWAWEGLRNIIKLYYEVKHIQLPKVPVKEVMITNPITIFRKTSVSEAARIMRKNDFGQLPIRDSKDKLLAMVYELDLLTAITR